MLGVISSALSERIKKNAEDHCRRNTALAATTTESLRNIKLVKSLGLAHQEVERFNGITDKILKLELKKVKYLRSFSFRKEEAAVDAHTHDGFLFFLMLYLIFRQQITIGDSFRCCSIRFSFSGRCRSWGTSSTSIVKRKSRYGTRGRNRRSTRSEARRSGTG